MTETARLLKNVRSVFNLRATSTRVTSDVELNRKYLHLYISLSICLNTYLQHFKYCGTQLTKIINPESLGMTHC